MNLNNSKENSFPRFFSFTVLALLFIVSILLAVLAFYNHPLADDYWALNLRKTYWFLEMQKNIYNNWGGRYTSNFIYSLFTSNNFLIKYYFAHTLILIFLSFFSILYWTSTVNRYFLNLYFTNADIWIISSLFFLTIFCSICEIHTAFYWFSSSVVYQFSLICLFATHSILITFLAQNENIKNIFSFLFLAIFIFITNGTNELIALLTGIISLLTILFYNKKKFYNGYIIFLFLIYVTSLIFSLYSPGNFMRLSLFDDSKTNLLLVLSSLIFRLMQILQSILSSVLFYFTSIIIFLLGNSSQLKVQFRFKQLNFFYLFIFWIIILCFTLLPILFISKGSFPDRALNTLIALTIIVFMSIIFYWGHTFKLSNLKSLINSKKELKILGTLFFIVSCIFHPQFINLTKSIIAAPAFNNVMLERTEILQKNSHANTISLATIDNSLDSLVSTQYSSQKEIIKKIILGKPTFLISADDLNEDINRNAIAQYYRIKIITTNK